jgi:hypothetical protein
MCHYAPCHEGVRGSDVKYAVGGGESSVSPPGRFTRGESALGTHFTGDWVVPSVYLDAVG